MVRDYSSHLRPNRGLWIPRWLVIAVAVVFVGTLTLRILKPPQWNLQRLDSPDASMRAEIWQAKYLNYAYKVKVRHGAIWHTVYNGSEFKADFTKNYRPTLYWDKASQYLLFSVEGKPVIIYDAQKQTLTSPAKATLVLQEHFNDVFLRASRFDLYGFV